MAGRGTSILWFFVKWLVIPIGLAAIGYFFIGSRIGASGETPRQPDIEDTGATTSNPPKESRQAAHTEPQIEIESRPVNPRKRTNKLRPKPEEPEESTAPKDPEQDPGSVGGAGDPPPLTDPVEPPAGGDGGDGAGIGG
ncbi:MAG: hypothetical protein KF784_12325 [Fimbriimonadaceae bacterium]|nr:hypothetical protein [Fimbriimonadaceae bacterium]